MINRLIDRSMQRCAAHAGWPPHIISRHRKARPTNTPLVLAHTYSGPSCPCTGCTSGMRPPWLAAAKRAPGAWASACYRRPSPPPLRPPPGSNRASPRARARPCAPAAVAAWARPRPPPFDPSRTLLRRVYRSIGGQSDTIEGRRERISSRWELGAPSRWAGRGGAEAVQTLGGRTAPVEQTRCFNRSIRSLLGRLGHGAFPTLLGTTRTGRVASHVGTWGRVDASRPSAQRHQCPHLAVMAAHATIRRPNRQKSEDR